MNAIEIRGLEKTYKNFHLGPLDLTLPSGCIMGLVGENGAGKSTTIKLILDMIEGDGGYINVLGMKRGNPDYVRVKEDIGVVLDEAGFPDCMNAKQIGQMMKQVFSRWDEALYYSYLKKLAIPQDKEFGKYSRGMKMKQGIAVALSHHPKLLILDEATSGLDPVVRDEVVDIFSEFTRDEEHAVLISSHIVSDLEKLCDYIAFIHQGKLLLCEEKDMLLSQYGVIHCSKQKLEELDSSAILGRRVSPYGVDAIVKREMIPEGIPAEPVGIEELFVFMVKR